jgi:hypothetical protein
VGFTAFIGKIMSKKPKAISDRDQLPPFYTMEAALLTRIHTWRAVFFAVTGVLLVVIAFQQRVIFHKLFQKMGESVVIVPGAPEFFRVRPGQIPDESVFLFAEYVAANLGNFSHRNVAYHFGKVTRFMHPTIRNTFEQSYESRVKDWSERKVDQTFAYEPVRQYDLIKDQKGGLYVTAVQGMRVQYVEGQAFSETRDLLVVEFRPLGDLTPEKPFLFEIEKLEWMNPEQFSAYKAARGLGKENP